MGQDDLERECEATPEHDAFKGKFRPKLTTDDCLTPPEVHAAVLAWAAREYGFDPSDAVRPFWPGGDYERFDYPEGCVVVDNPPFSILARIVRFYLGRAIPFFLYALHLTALGHARRPRRARHPPGLAEGGRQGGVRLGAAALRVRDARQGRRRRGQAAGEGGRARGRPGGRGMGAVGSRASALPGDGVRRRDGMVPIDS
ncbi:hypothetical protein HLV35_03055 [Eggerthellaceae bacterium zg-997]|nr:hypothetical protein [Eggerthellaceae bacterium zg-997]